MPLHSTHLLFAHLTRSVCVAENLTNDLCLCGDTFTRKRQTHTRTHKTFKALAIECFKRVKCFSCVLSAFANLYFFDLMLYTFICFESNQRQKTRGVEWKKTNTKCSYFLQQKHFITFPWCRHLKSSIRFMCVCLSLLSQSYQTGVIFSNELHSALRFSHLILPLSFRFRLVVFFFFDGTKIKMCNSKHYQHLNPNHLPKIEANSVILIFPLHFIYI